MNASHSIAAYACLHLFALVGTLVCFEVAAAEGADVGATAAAPQSAGRVATLDSEPATARPSSTRLIFTCRESGELVLSDRPCGPAPLRRELALSAAGAAPSTAPTPTRARAHARTTAARSTTRVAVPVVAAAPAASPCEALAEQLSALDSRMRTGYTARESAALWERRRGLKRRWHDARC